MGSSVAWWVEGKWRAETLAAEVVGLSRPVTVLWARRSRSGIIAHGDFGRGAGTFCPATWYDLAIGSGPCGLGCRLCFLILTHRAFRDPCRHVLYENFDDFEQAVRTWLRAPDRRPVDPLGIGIDRSDSLLLRGRCAACAPPRPAVWKSPGEPAGLSNDTFDQERQCPLSGGGCSGEPPIHHCQFFAEPTPALKGGGSGGDPDDSPGLSAVGHTRMDTGMLDTYNIPSVNPQGIADLWEGRYADGERIPPTVSARLEAARAAQDLGYEVRLRVDPILWPDGWEEMYWEFVAQARESACARRHTERGRRPAWPGPSATACLSSRNFKSCKL